MPADVNLDSLPPKTAESPATSRGAAQEQPERSTEMSSRPVKSSRVSRRWSIRWALFALLPLAVASGAYRYVTGGQLMSTDDAYVNAETVGVSTDVSGIVQQIGVTENQHVDKTQVLYRLDPRQFQIAVGIASANLAQTALTITSMKQD
jgi:membrane fusion protein (multidrug efflux system)